MATWIDQLGLRRGLTPRPMPVGPASVAVLVDSLPVIDQPALIDRNGTLTYSQLAMMTRAAALGLRALGIGPGTVVAACAPNLNELIIAYLAVQRIGGMWAGVNPSLASREKAAQLRDCGAVVFLGDEAAISQIGAEREALPDLTSIVSIGPRDGEFASLIREHEGLDLHEPLPDPFAPAAVGYTSGTTGQPKGVVHSQHSLMTFLNGCYSHSERRHWVKGARRGFSIPLTILNGMTYGPLAALVGGGTFVAMDRSDAAGVGEWIEKHGVEIFNGSPTTIRDLLVRPELRNLDLSSLRAVVLGGTAVPDNLFGAFRDRFGFELVAEYGLTESPASVLSSNPNLRPKAGALGKPHPHVEVAIMTSVGERLPMGEVGELCVGSVSEGEWAGVYTGMLGYWRKPEETASAFYGEWLRTGDSAVLDQDGVFSIVGRKKEMIIRGGANIYPAEVESVLRLHRSIEDVVVIGLPDERLGEIIAAYLILCPGERPNNELAGELRRYSSERIARYKIPERWFVVDEFPRNAMNKPVRNLLSTLLYTELKST